jgi:hypothetical protein
LAYSIVANTQQFTSGIVASKQELRTLKEAFLQSQSPVERYSAAIAHLESLATKFPAKAQAVNATIAKMRQEMHDASEAGQRLAKQKELVNNVMGRMGLVLDPVSASFQAFNMAVGLAQTALHTFERIASAVGDEMGRLDELAKKSATLGIDASSLVGLRRAAEDLSGVASDAFDTAFTTFTRRIGEAAMTGTGDAAKALERLSLNGTDLSAMAPDDAFMKVAEAISKVQNPTERLTLAYQLLGRQGAELATTLAAGPEAIQALIERQQELSQIEFVDLQAIQEANDALGEMKTVLTGVLSLLASESAPLVKDLAGDFTDAATAGKGLKDEIQLVVFTVAALVDELESLAKIGGKAFSFLDKVTQYAPILSSIRDSAGFASGLASGAVSNSITGNPDSRLNNLVDSSGASLVPNGETSRSAIETDVDAIEKKAKAAQAAADKEADFHAMEIKAQMDLATAVEEAEKRKFEARAKSANDRQAEIADMEEKARKDFEAFEKSIQTPAEKLKQELEDLNELRARGLDDAMFNKGLADLRSKARDLSDQANVQPQTIGAVRAGSIEALRAQFGGRNVSEKQLEEQRKAVAEAATASGLLSEIKTLLATTSIKEAL